MMHSRRMKKIEVSPSNRSKQVRTIEETVEYLRMQSVKAGQKVECLQGQHGQDSLKSIIAVAQQRLQRIMETLKAVEEARN